MAKRSSRKLDVHTETGQPCESGGPPIFNMKTYRVQFVDLITAESEEAAYDILLRYLSDCAKYGDATAFEFQEEDIKEEVTH